MKFTELKKFKKQFGLILLITLALLVFDVLFLTNLHAYRIDTATKDLALGEIDIETWSSTLNRYGMDLETNENSNLILAIDLYNSRIDGFNKFRLVKLQKIEVNIVSNEERELFFEIIEESDNGFIENEKYLKVVGTKGKETVIDYDIKYRDIVSQNEYVEKVEESTNEINVTGKMKIDDVKTLVGNNARALLKSIQDSDNAEFVKYVLNQSPALFESLDKTSPANLEYADFAVQLDEGEHDDFILVGFAIYKNANCISNKEIEVYYKKSSHEYLFNNVEELSFGCKVTQNPTQTPTSSVNVMNCTDCKLAPVDKENQLPQNYIPNVITTNLSGGGSVTSETNSALEKMFSDASSQGINISIISSYRSFETQRSTFESWVQRELNMGYSRTEAEQRANTYSAKQGHSEHQLGTTVDLKCSSCASFDNSEGNLAVYMFLENNAHKYGFVISYPKNTQHLTGYVYEPWHIRFIGVDLATEHYESGYTSGNGNYLAKFLRIKGYTY